MQTLQFHDLPTTPIAPPPSARSMLEKIVWHKQQEVAQMQTQVSLEQLQKVLDAPRADVGFLGALRQRKPSLIAEVKKASPSRGVIRSQFEPVLIAQAYERSGASCISVLTDQAFFQGSFEYLWDVRQAVRIPLLCKEFIIDPYQVYLARSAGADAILLIAAILTDEQLRELLQLSHHLGMNALVEVHTLDELDRVLSSPHAYLIGINNRSLSDFTVNIKTTQMMLTQRRVELDRLGVTVVSESGLERSSDVKFVTEAGAHAVLVGESLLRQRNLEQAVYRLIPSSYPLPSESIAS
jgi:indole-3-glycerol phosphate synthase